MRTCDELVKPLVNSLLPKGQTQADLPVRLLDPETLTDDFWYFARDWLRRIGRAADADTDQARFDGFIYLWVVLNGWASQVITEPKRSDDDKFLVAALAWDPDLGSAFDRLKEHDPDFHRLTAEFASRWPVFRVTELRKLKIPFWNGDQTRAKYVRSVVQRPEKAPTKENYRPPCFRQHENERHEEVGIVWHGPPNDWPHTISAIYQVRCNLFHGGKTYEVSRDREFVGMAFRILWTVWREFIPKAYLKTAAAQPRRDNSSVASGSRPSDTSTLDTPRVAGRDT